MRRALLIVLACSTGACAPRLYVNVLRPAAVNLGPTKRLAIVYAEGRRDARELVIQELVTQCRMTGYFTVEDRSLDGGGPKPGEVGMRLEVREWSATHDTSPARDRAGAQVTFTGRVQLGVTVVDDTGNTVLAPTQYPGAVSSTASEDAAILDSARAAVGAVLSDLTPTFERKAIYLDNEDDEQRPIVDLARDGDIRVAIAEERHILSIRPNSAPALFNLAAMLDALGEYDEALAAYDKAIALDDKSLYSEMREECARRRSHAKALAR